MRNHYRAASDPTGRHGAPTQPPPAELENAAGPDDDRSFWARPSVEGRAGTALPMTNQGSAARRFQRALAIGNPRLVRAAAAELPDIGLAEAAAILLVIERTEPENYEHTALRWLAKLATEAPHVDFSGLAHAATALEALPHEPAARATLAEICTTAGRPEAAAVFASDHRRPMPPPD
jgi:thioredoxin-like negative regulator of GroEL